MVIIQADANSFVSNPDPIEDERVAREWAAVVVEVGRTVMTDVCVECGQVIVWVHEFALWAVGGDAHSGSGVRCAGALDEMHAPVVEVVR